MREAEEGNSDVFIDLPDQTASVIPDFGLCICRPLLRTKSESDFQALLDDEDVDVEKMRERLVKRYGKPHGSFHLKALPSLTRQQWIVLATLAIVEFFSFCTMSILAPFFPSEVKLTKFRSDFIN